MRAQRRRFVVEVKRGTSRAAFLSPDGAADKFGSAEDALFGPREKPSAAAPVVAPALSAPALSAPASSVVAPRAPTSMGRVLRDLHEPPPPPLPDLPAPARRGRKPGSKNKPKPVLAAPAAMPAPTSARPLWADAVAEYASPRPAPEPLQDDVSPAESAAREVPQAAAADTPSPIRRARLRDRSTILKRYVLGSEPAPGQTGWLRGLRAKRQG